MSSEDIESTKETITEKIVFKLLKKDEKHIGCKKYGKGTIHKKSIKFVCYRQVPKNCYQYSECGKKP